MLIMTESIFLIEPTEQKLYFNQTLHRSMIWILDKAIQAMRKISLYGTDGYPSTHQLAPTFENINLGPRNQAFATLVVMCKGMDATYGGESWYSSDAQYYVDMIPSLPDVSGLWQAQPDQPTLGKPGCDISKYLGIPKFPQHPPATG